MSDDLLEQLAQLHEDATEAIRDGRLAAYERASEAYSQTLLALPQAWARYRLRYTCAVTAPLGLIDLGVLSAIESHLSSEMRTAMLSDNPEMASKTTWFPYSVAAKAVALGATELVSRMLGLLVALFTATKAIAPTRQSDSVARWCCDAIMSFGEYNLRPQDAASSEAALEVSDLIDAVLLKINELMKASVEAHDIITVQALDARLSSMFQFWHPEQEGLDHDTIAFMVARDGADSSAVHEARRQIERLAPQISLREQFDGQRNLLFLGLAMWTLRRILRRQVTTESDIGIFNTLGAHFVNPSLLAKTTTQALARSFEDGPWHSWLLSEAAGQTTVSGAHGFSFAGPDTDFLQCFLVLLVRITDPGAGPSLPAEDWMSSRLSEMQRILDGLVNASELWGGLQVISAPERIAQVRLSLEDAVRRLRVNAEHELADAEISVERVIDFIARARAGWASSRIAPLLFRSVDALVEEEGPPPADLRPFAWRAYLGKELFVESAQVARDLGIGSEIGATISKDELTSSINSLAEVAEFPFQGKALADGVHEALVQMHAEGYSPTLLIAGVDWRVWQALGTEEGHGSVGALFGLPEKQRYWLRGTVEGIPVLAWPGASNDWVYVIDLARVARWRQWSASAEGEPLHVEVTDFKEPEATGLVTENPELARDGQHDGIAERSRRLRCLVLVSAIEFWSLEIRDRQAARRLYVPDPGSVPVQDNGHGSE